MADTEDWQIQELVPHAGRMCLLDRLVSVEGETLIAEVELREDHLFLDSLGPGTGVGAWVGIEYMAQAVAAWAGAQARAAGEAPKIGFLLGSRRYRCELPRFERGQVLQVVARREYQADNGLGQFACEIRLADRVVASAQVTVFGPDDPEKFIRGETT
ncbi:3-hydroxylacyl-ACP dehydratase [Ideonella azotifigens]|uniref:Hotdog family protein n=1 Tax=Ideonella azotifigens TaxID=513160 RepID=A0ABN1KAP7_9BURK|nr:3-hydroxylacyl-ACP dehydratase [Ideonella azotifigens]MCD2338800.1 3-hydroxylacyl-ACP dehydratase [Ideonella azotifigens]